MNTRNALLLLAGLLVLALAVFPIGCSQPEEAPVAEQAAEQAPPAAAEEPIYTRDDPGAWEGKESGHLPVIEYEKAGDGLTVTVTVNHVMDNETPHYIMWIKLLDGEGNVLGQQDFEATEEKAVATFELSTIPAKLVAHEKCNLHGIWMEEVAVS
jgi:desulfoferrodoxin-like iron-binding protein